jgi:hypothetical protein
MYGLSVRWSLSEAAAGVADTLRKYVRDESLSRFSGMPGLRFKTWRMVPGEWFEGTYVWETAQARADFLARFQAGVATAPGTRIIGAEPAEYLEFEVVAVAEGGSGFAAGVGPEAARSSHP